MEGSVLQAVSSTAHWPNPRQMKVALFCFVTIPSLLLPPPIYKYGTFFSSVLDSLCVFYSFRENMSIFFVLFDSLCLEWREGKKKGCSLHRQGKADPP